MNWKHKALGILLAVLAVFAAGTYVGYNIPREVTPVETVFTPYEDGLARYLEFLDRAKSSVRVAVFTFTEPRIADKLIELKTQRKVDVKVLMDLSQATKSWNADDEEKLIKRMRAAGIEVIIGTSEKSRQIMHNKFTIVDGVWIEDGSWNYTRLANKQGNILNFQRDASRAKKFLDYWDKMYRFMKAQMDSGAAQPAAEDEDEEDKPAKPAKTPTRRPRR